MHLQVALHAAGESGRDSDLAARLAGYEPIRSGGGLYPQLKLALWLCMSVLYMRLVHIDCSRIRFSLFVAMPCMYYQYTSCIFSRDLIHCCPRCCIKSTKNREISMLQVVCGVGVFAVLQQQLDTKLYVSTRSIKFRDPKSS